MTAAMPIIVDTEALMNDSPPDPAALLMAKDIAQDCVIELILETLYRGATDEQISLLERRLTDRLRYRFEMPAGQSTGPDPMEIQSLALEMLTDILGRVRRQKPRSTP
jgi:hypothetical protein